MKLLISGTTGFIGKHLVQTLQDNNIIVHAIVRHSTKQEHYVKNVTYYQYNGDIERLTEYMVKEKFDGVVHLASLFLSQHTQKNLAELLESNIIFSTSLLEAAVASNTPWFLNTGTFWQHYKNKTYSPVNVYAATKQAFETLAQYYRETSSIQFVTIKLCDTFGKNDTRKKIFNLWQQSSKTGEELEMSPGKQYINISHVDNITSGYLTMITLLSKDKKKKYDGKSFVVSSDTVVPLKKLAHIFEKITNTKLNIIWGKKEYRPREVMKPWDKGIPIPNWKPPISLEEGIRKTMHHDK